MLVPSPATAGRGSSAPIRCFPTQRVLGAMSRFLSILIVLLLLVIAGGMVFLASWDLPAPSKTVEKVLPDERFPR
ncbi:hypothetical protein A6A40_14770 [Azospirillum humicireducens]|uniref:Uncharacterized protein n=1 Tax=Azospirillum humicireducens TaxID=1226968 RepID=A0A2R4VPK7_9PROT|nr:hypothetical protein A6A40_14770 [Azospirillum humicireducens]KAA0580341.1 hypothetical protein FZ983_12200 [Azospirillum sp. B21]MBF5093429.1 hypothetical protein [Azospirillum sp. INR13]